MNVRLGNIGIYGRTGNTSRGQYKSMHTYSLAIIQITLLYHLPAPQRHRFAGEITSRVSWKLLPK